LNGYKEDEIVTNTNDIPRFKYKIDDKIHYYFPDIFLPSKSKIIEVDI
jgi:hypothetical protein